MLLTSNVQGYEEIKAQSLVFQFSLKMLDGKDGNVNEKLQPRSNDLSSGTRLEKL